MHYSNKIVDRNDIYTLKNPQMNYMYMYIIKKVYWDFDMSYLTKVKTLFEHY